MIRYTLDISEDEDLVIDFEGRDTLDLDIEVLAVHWGNDGVGWTQVGSCSEYDAGHDYIEDIEIGEILLVRDDGKHVKLCEKHLAQVNALLATDEGFEQAVSSREEAERQSRLLESAIEREERKNG